MYTDQYISILPENKQAGIVVATVTATDNDMSDSNNSVISYSIFQVLSTSSSGSSGGAAGFDINATSGEITTTTMLDYEAVQSYTITVEARDGGVPPMSRYIAIATDGYVLL